MEVELKDMLIDLQVLKQTLPDSSQESFIKGQSRSVESLVRAKMQHKEFIILCLEDCSDWSNATTRRVVMQTDPELSRTVIVSTKLDTKIPQFVRSSDVEVFLRPPACTLDACWVTLPSLLQCPSEESVLDENLFTDQMMSLNRSGRWRGGAESFCHDDFPFTFADCHCFHLVCRFHIPCTI